MNELKQQAQGAAANLLIGDRVTRISTDYTNGRTGKIVDLDANGRRAQVKWDGERTTWVGFLSLKKEGSNG